MISLNAGKSLSLKPGRVGGFYNSLNMIKNCQENKISLCCGGMFETGIGRAYTLALSSLEAITEVGDMVPSGHYFEKDLIEPEWKHSEKGFITVPRTSPGLGIRINEKLIDKLSVRSERFSN